MRRLRPLGLSIALLTASCANPSATDPSASLTARVASIRAAVENGNVDRARILLDRLESAVGRLLANDALTEEQAVEIVSAAEDVADALFLFEPQVSPSSTPTSSPSPSQDDEGDGNDEGHGKGKDKGKGHGDED